MAAIVYFFLLLRTEDSHQGVGLYRIHVPGSFFVNIAVFYCVLFVCFFAPCATNPKCATGVGLQAAALSLYPPGPPGLHPHGAVPQRVPVDNLGLR